MKNATLRVVLALFAMVWLAAFAYAADDSKAMMHSKGMDVEIKGTLTCAFCKLAHPTMKPNPECCKECVKHGESPLLTDKDGNQYILLTGEKGMPLMNQERMEMLGGMVKVKGVLVKGKGVQAIYVEKMEKMEMDKKDMHEMKEMKDTKSGY